MDRVDRKGWMRAEGEWIWAEGEWMRAWGEWMRAEGEWIWAEGEWMRAEGEWMRDVKMDIFQKSERFGDPGGFPGGTCEGEGSHLHRRFVHTLAG